MNAENARRLAARQQRDALKISVVDVEEYRELHYPGSRAERDAFVAKGGVEIPSADYIAKLSHERFHTWFGTFCDDTCPHARVLPAAKIRRRSRWRRLLGLRSL